jgi:hypothetical protein
MASFAPRHCFVAGSPNGVCTATLATLDVIHTCLQIRRLRNVTLTAIGRLCTMMVGTKEPRFLIACMVIFLASLTLRGYAAFGDLPSVPASAKS